MFMYFYNVKKVGENKRKEKMQKKNASDIFFTCNTLYWSLIGVEQILKLCQEHYYVSKFMKLLNKSESWIKAKSAVLWNFDYQAS